MPVYQYICLNCSKRFELFLSYKEYDLHAARCPRCQSEDVRRRIGRVRFARSEDSRLDDLAGSDLDGLDEDPQALGRMMRKMSREMGEEMGPEFDEVVDRLESGQSPDEIEQAIPDFGGEAGSPGMDDDF
jgi:putative FmdB family regulatory protein